MALPLASLYFSYYAPLPKLMANTKTTMQVITKRTTNSRKRIVFGHKKERVMGIELSPAH